MYLRRLFQRAPQENPNDPCVIAARGLLRDEPFVVIEPHTGLGIVGQMSGVADNYQLHMLLLDAFPNPTAATRISQSHAQVARGEGPQQVPGNVTGAWNMYAATALAPGAGWPEPGTQHYIWNEGIPADIPVIDGHRCIVLGPPPYVRGFTACRLFDIPASLGSVRTLDRDSVEAWVSRASAG